MVLGPTGRANLSPLPYPLPQALRGQGERSGRARIAKDLGEGELPRRTSADASIETRLLSDREGTESERGGRSKTVPPDCGSTAEVSAGSERHQATGAGKDELTRVRSSGLDLTVTLQ